jgi:hypothetical protein
MLTSFAELLSVLAACHLRDDFQGAIEAHSQVHPPCIYAETLSRAGREMTSRLRADMRKVKASYTYDIQ